MSDDAEARFLRAREARAQQRRAEQAGSASEDAVAAAQLLVDARKQLSELLATSGKAHDELLAPYLMAASGGGGEGKSALVAPPAVIAQAMALWRSLQEGVQRILNDVKLPAHDVQQGNSALAKRLQAIEAARLGRGSCYADSNKENARSDGNNNDNAESASADQGRGYQKRQTRRFRFRRLENYKEAEQQQLEAAEAAATASAATSTSASAVEVSTKRAANAAIAAAGEANAIEGLEPKMSHMIVAKQAAFVRHCNDCRIFIAPVSGSVFLAGLTDCTVYVACRQLRMKDCARCDIFVCCASTPVIEDSSKIRFGSLAAWTAAVADDAALARIGKALDVVDSAAAKKRLVESYRSIDDFTWLRSTPSPHFVVFQEPGAWSAAVISDVQLPASSAPESVLKL